MHQRALVMVAGAEKEQGVMKIRLQNTKLWSSTKGLFQVQERY